MRVSIATRNENKVNGKIIMESWQWNQQNSTNRKELYRIARIANIRPEYDHHSKEENKLDFRKTETFFLLRI